MTKRLLDLFSRGQRSVALRSPDPYRIVPGLILGLVSVVLAAPVVAEPPRLDPFYSNLLSRGQAARAAGEAGAENTLRIACFGMLEAPPRLAACLVELALAQNAAVSANAGDTGEFDESVRRLAAIEQQFRAYSTAAANPALLSPALATEFQAVLAAHAPSSVLDSVPAFRQAAVQRRTQELGRLAPEARQGELEQLLLLQPQEPRWRHELAQLALDNGQAERAFELATQLPVAAYGCTRSRARAAVGDCAGAAAEAASCAPPIPEPVWKAQLSCLINAGAWRAASDLQIRLPAQLRSQKAYRRIGREITRALRTLPATTPDEVVLTEQPMAPPAAATAGGEQTPIAKQATDAQQPPSPAPATQPTTPSPVPPAAVPRTAPAAETPPPRDAAALSTLLVRSRRALLDAATEEEVLKILDGTESLRRRFGKSAEILLHVAEINYRLRRWRATVDAVQASGLDLEERPRFLFYYAVALYESGDHAAATSAIQRAWPRIRQTEFVRTYATKILGRAPS